MGGGSSWENWERENEELEKKSSKRKDPRDDIAYVTNISVPSKRYKVLVYTTYSERVTDAVYAVAPNPEEAYKKVLDYMKHQNKACGFEYYSERLTDGKPHISEIEFI